MRLRLTAAFYGGKGFSLYHAFGSASRVPLSPHFHDEYLISAQLRGDERCHVAGKLHEFRAGDLALINPQQVHTGNTEGDEVEYISLYIDAGRVAQLAAGLTAEGGRAGTETPEFTVVRAPNQPALIEQMCQLLAAVQGNGPSCVFPTVHGEDDPAAEIPAGVLDRPVQTALLDVETALVRVMTYAFEEFSNLRTPQVRSTHRIGHRKIARALDYMRELPATADADAIALDRLAEIAELSKFHFLRQFNQVVGMTPGAYLRTLRMCQAGRLLRGSEAPIVDVASAVGFADHPSFSRAFARYMGMTPSEYRRLGPL